MLCSGQLTRDYIIVKLKKKACDKQLGGDNGKGGSRAARLNTPALFKGGAIMCGSCLPHGGSRVSMLLDPSEEVEDCIHC